MPQSGDEPRTFGLAQLSVGHGGPRDPRLFVKDSEGELICVFPPNFPLEHLPSVLLRLIPLSVSCPLSSWPRPC
jgi:hypothetical protein